MPLPPSPSAPAAELLPRRADLSNVSGGAAARARTKAPFLLGHPAGHKGSWEVRSEGLPGPCWLPTFVELQIESGAGGMRMQRGGMEARQRYAAVKSARESEGHVVLEAVSGHPLLDFLAELPVVGGKRYMLIFDRLVERLAGEAPREVRDWAEYNLWRLKLIDQGVLPSASDAAIDDALKSIRLTVDRRRRATHLHPEVRDAELNKAIDVVDLRQDAFRPRRGEINAWLNADAVKASAEVDRSPASAEVDRYPAAATSSAGDLDRKTLAEALLAEANARKAIAEAELAEAAAAEAKTRAAAAEAEAKAEAKARAAATKAAKAAEAGAETQT